MKLISVYACVQKNGGSQSQAAHCVHACADRETWKNHALRLWSIENEKMNLKNTYRGGYQLKVVSTCNTRRTYSKMAIDMMEIYGANHSVMKLKNIESTRNL